MTALYKHLLETSLNCETLSKQLQYFIELCQEKVKVLSPNDWQFDFYQGQIVAYKICLDKLNNDVIKNINLNS